MRCKEIFMEYMTCTLVQYLYVKIRWTDYPSQIHKQQIDSGFNTRMRPNKANRLQKNVKKNINISRLTINGLHMCQAAFSGLEWKNLKVTSEKHLNAHENITLHYIK